MSSVIKIENLSKVLIKNKKVHILSDDIYEHLKYDNFSFFTIAQISKLKDRTLTMNGVSKSYAMTGWRIGYAAGPKEIIKAIGKIQSQSTSNPSSVSQAAAVEALNGAQDFIQQRSDAFKERRDFVVNSLNNIKGISCLKPNGAFYVFPSCKKLLGKKTKLKTDADFVDLYFERHTVNVNNLTFIDEKENKESEENLYCTATQNAISSSLENILIMALSIRSSRSFSV